MKKLTMLFAVALLLPAVQAVAADPALENYARRAFTNCPGSAVSLQKVDAAPAGFTAYRATQTSIDNRCGRATYLLTSNKTGQILFVDVFSLPEGKESVESRLAALGTRLLHKPVTAKVGKEVNAEGLRRVTLTTASEYGPFDFHGWIDSSSKFFMVGRMGPKNTDPGDLLLKELGAAKAPMRGNTMARVRIVEVSDFQCPTCARAHNILEPFIAKNLNKISYTRLDLPLFEHHDWVMPAALAGRAIQQIAPNKYWEYVDHIFRNQEVINKGNVDRFIRDFAEDNAISMAKLRAIADSPAEKKALMEQKSRAYGSGIFGTPTFIVNGQQVFYGNDADYVKKVIEAALAGR